MEFKKYVRTFFLAALLALVAVGAAAAAVNEPLAGERRMFLRERAVVTCYDTDAKYMRTFVGTDRLRDANGDQTDMGDLAAISGRTLRESAFVSPSNKTASTAGFIKKSAPDGLYRDTGEIQSGVVCTVNFLHEKNGVVVLMTEIGGSNGQLSLSSPLPIRDIPVVAPQLHRKSGVKDLVLSSAATVNVDIAGEDWDGDGWTDYILSYPTPTATDSNVESQAFVYIDGRTLADACLNANGSPVVSYNQTVFPKRNTKNNGGGARIAKGDIDGDGSAELIAHVDGVLYAYTVTPQSGGRATLAKIAEKDIWAELFSDREYNSDRHRVVSVGVGAGDFNNDGKAEVAAIVYGQFDYASYINYNGYLRGALYSLESGGFSVGVKLPYASRSGSSSGYISEYEHITNFPPIDVVAADLDGDGADELAYAYVKFALSFATKSVRSAICVNTQKVKTNTAGILELGDSLTRHVLRDYQVYPLPQCPLPNFSMTAARLVDQKSGESYGLAKQLVLAAINPIQSSPLAPLSWGVYSAKDGITPVYEKGAGIQHNVKSDVDSYARPMVVGADLYNESLTLGEPVEISVMESIKPILVMQAPPRHWDIISGDFGNGSDAHGNTPADAFATLANYATSSKSSSASSSITTKTDSSSFEWGLKGSFSLSTIFTGKKPLLEAGGSHANKKANENTSSKEYSTSFFANAKAQNDDQIFYTQSGYTIWRYPVMAPAEEMYETATIDGESVETRKFMQITVPKTVNAVALPTAGRIVDWYQPSYDNRNLFTYPKAFVQIPSYPRGHSMKNPGDPWLFRNGMDLVNFTDQWIGNPDAASTGIDISSKESKTAKESSISTAGSFQNSTASASILKIVTLGYSFSSHEDWAWNTTKVGTTNASEMQGITINWPDAVSYKSASGVGLVDQQFKAGASIYTADDGSFNVSYIVNQLARRINDQDSLLWGPNSPYARFPDPGLNLPNRYNYDTTPNTRDKPFLIRGMSFSKNLHNLVPISEPVTGTFRIFNYSFVPTDPFTCTVLYQDLRAQPNGYLVPDLSQAVEITTVGVDVIPGRDSGISDNWTDVHFNWTPPATAGNGYIHVLIKYDGPQLSSTNDWGYALVGRYDPWRYGDAKSTAASRAAFGDSGVALTDGLDLLVGGVNPVDENDRLIEGMLPGDRVSYIETEIRLEKTDSNVTLQGLPLVCVNAYVNDDILLASKIIPFMGIGQRVVLDIPFDPRQYPHLKSLDTLTIQVSSSFHSEDEAIEANNSVTIPLEGHDVPLPDAGNGSGCDANASGSAVLAVTALIATILRRVHKKRVQI